MNKCPPNHSRRQFLKIKPPIYKQDNKINSIINYLSLQRRCTATTVKIVPTCVEINLVRFRHCKI